MHSAGLHPICLRSFKQSKSTFPPSSIAVWERPIIPDRGEKFRSSLVKNHTIPTNVLLCFIESIPNYLLAHFKYLKFLLANADPQKSEHETK